MTVFRAGETAPAWCELRRFELIDLPRGAQAERTPEDAAERLLGTAGTVQVRHAGRSVLLKEGQFLDLGPGSGPWTAIGAADASGLVRLCGNWGADIAGCGIFRVRPTDAPETKGDPVSYRKTTAIDSHYHDCDEYWIVLEGSGEAVVGDRHQHVAPGDCLPIGMGHHHDFPLTDNEVKAVFFETTLLRQKRIGHLWNHTHGPAVPDLERV